MKKALYPAKPILIVDDQPNMLLYLEAALKKSGLNNICSCEDSQRVCTLLAEQAMALVLLDLNMPPPSGEELLAIIRRDHPEVPVIIVTSTEEVETVVKCIKLGAIDYVVKPVDQYRLSKTVKSTLALQELCEENRVPYESIKSAMSPNSPAFASIVTNNSQMLALFRYVESIARSPEPVLITGETGVGKDLLARALHTLSGREGSLVSVNVAGLDSNMFSDTLFGHARGAFTGAEKMRKGLVEQAAGGTLFLDEIGDLATDSQAKLLRLLQDGDYMPLGQDKAQRINARVVSASNRDLWALVHEDKFRKDLNFRLRTHHIHVPPLRNRREDIPLLVEYFLAHAAIELKRPRPAVSNELVSLLEGYEFPGNVRELRAMVYNAVSVTSDKTLSITPFRQHIMWARQHHSHQETNATGDATVKFPHQLPSLKEATELLVKEALKRANGNQSLAGRILGVSQQAISKRLKNLDQ